MRQTIALLLPLLAYAASTVGAGALAFATFVWLRQQFPQPSVVPVRRIQRWCYLALYAPRYARVSALILAALISILASLAMAFLSHADVLVSLDNAVSAALAAIISQLTHAAVLSPTMPAPRRARIYEVHHD